MEPGSIKCLPKSKSAHVCFQLVITLKMYPISVDETSELQNNLMRLQRGKPKDTHDQYSTVLFIVLLDKINIWANVRLTLIW